MNGALANVRIIDLADERGIYGTKLLADLGADVVRVEPPGGDPLRQRGPFTEAVDGDGQGASLYYAYMASSRRSFVVDPGDETSRHQLRALIERADVIIATDDHFCAEWLDLPTLRESHQVYVDITSFGREGPWADYLAPDLVAGALGGSLATTGAADTPPLKSFGELNFMVSGSYVAIAALSALFNKRAEGAGQRVGVSVHECIASCLEQVFMFYWYHEVMGRPEGQVLPRRGATHWSNAYTVMNGQDGSIMITPTPDFDKQLAWLIEEEAHGDLLDEQYMDPENIMLLVGRMMQLLGEWVSGKSVESLFHEAQSRHIPYGWVQPLARVAENPQLAARQWWVPVQIGDQQINAPGAPYHVSATPWALSGPSEAGAQTQEILADIGWSTDND